METLREVPQLPKPTCQGWIPGFRTWTLYASDQNGKEICRVSEKRSNNALKYVDFINNLVYRGYKLSRDQRHYLKYDQGLGFMDPVYLKFVTYGNLVEIVQLAGFTENEVRESRNKPERIQQLFAERLGLEYEELRNCLAKI